MIIIRKEDICEVPKYKKKKESSTSKSMTKSKHKHDYSKECLLIADASNHPCYATYCNICGKIENVKLWETERTDEGCFRTLSFGEVYEKYKDLEKIHVDDIWQKYVPISESR